MVRARVLNCVDGVNVALLQKATNEQRSFFREREHTPGDAEQPAHATWSGSLDFLRMLVEYQDYYSASEAVC